MRQFRRHKEKVSIVADYTCCNPNGEGVTIEYEFTIKSKKHYQEIIGQYMDVKDRGIIKQVIYFTDDGYIHRKKIAKKLIPENINYLKFL